MLTELFRRFSNQYKKDVTKKISSQLLSYQLLVNEIPNEIRKNLDHNDLFVKGSIGQGNTTYYPWIGIFDRRVSTGATNGFYVVILFSDDFDDIYLTLNQGSTIQSKETIEKNRNFIFKYYTDIPGFSKGELPRNSLVKINAYSSTNKGKMYEETNIYFKKYTVSNLDEEIFIIDLKKIVDIYVSCASYYTENLQEVEHITNLNFNPQKLFETISELNLKFKNQLIYRFISALCSKPFIILTGLSGSGKTKIAHVFAKWICENDSQYCLVPVGSDWNNREPLLGYPNALDQGKYVKPDNGVLDLLINASKPENSDKPFFLILDEMNLSHVERYFADFLSAMESGESISLHSDTADWKDNVPAQIEVPPNLFIIGTVNIDETTYMFSPKVLDRANVIEFRVTAEDLDAFLDNPGQFGIDSLSGLGSNMAADFVKIAKTPVTEFENKDEIKRVLNTFFNELKKTGSEFGYRSASEILRFSALLLKLTEKEESKWRIDDVIDAAIIQKLLPKLHGSRKKLEPVLKSLAELCLKNEIDNKADEIKKFEDDPSQIFTSESVLFRLSLEKILRMKKRVVQEGFTSFAEA